MAFLRTRVEFITAFFAPGEVSEVWLTFSDPQYRSENSRLCSPLFLERYRSFLRPGGVVHLKTDSRFLHEYARAVCAVNGLRVLACTKDLYNMAGCEPAGSSSLETSFGPHRCASLAVPPLNVPRVAVFPEAVAAAAPLFWPQNWRKGGLQERRNEVVREQGFYNQTWCGCEFSRKQNPLNQ